MTAAVDTPYLGTPFAPNQTILAVDYDKGGQGVAYHDTATTNQGGDNYRPGDVVGIQKDGSADIIAYTTAGEWLNYTISVPTAGKFTLEASVADLHTGAAISASESGTNLTGTMTVPNTGSWTTYTTITSGTFSLKAGAQILQIDFDKNDTGGAAGNLDWIKLVPVPASSPAAATAATAADTPYLGTPFTANQTIPAADYDKGGQGVAYGGTTGSNQGGDNYRPGDTVSIQLIGSQNVITYTQLGEYLNYTIDITTAGSYTLEASVSEIHSGAQIAADIGGVDLTGAMTVPDTGSWSTFSTITSPSFTVSAATQVMHLDFVKTDGNDAAGNLAWLKLVPKSSSGGGTTTGGGGTTTGGGGTTTGGGTTAGGGGTSGGTTGTSPIVSIKNTVNELTNQLIAPSVTPAPTVTVTGSNGGDSTAPTPVITELDPDGPAPHTVFVHALDSILGAGTPLTARYVWNFGDPGSEDNTLVGWNAGHQYVNPGTYTITLTLTNQLGKTRILSTTVTETSPSYSRVIYVNSVSGKDSNNGSSPSSAVQTFAEATKLVGNNTEVLFAAGDTFNVSATMPLPYKNVLITSYGSGSAPTLMCSAGTDILLTFSNSQNIVVENLTVNSIWGPVGNIANEISATFMGVAGVDITVRNCTFLNLEDAVDESGNPQGVLVQDCSAPLTTGLRAYLVWGQGTDQVIMGNYDANSTRQHDVRTIDTIRQLIYDNNLTNLDRTSVDPGDTNKGTIEVHRGAYAYISDNYTYDGDLRIGPRFGPSSVAGDTTEWTVVEGNHTFNYQFEIYPGTYNVMVRNNIFSSNTDPDVAIEPANSDGDSVSNITFANNTGVSSGVAGEFFWIGGGNTPNSVSLINNLWLAPEVVPGEHGNAGVFIVSSTYNVLAVSEHNVWQMPSTFNAYADGGINYVYSSWDPPNGYYTPTAWDKLPFVKSDYFSATAVSANYTPNVGTLAATAGIQTAGVLVDAAGNPRPSSGAISAGAMQTPGVG